MDVGAALREARWAAGWSIRELAHATGVNPSSISRYESGARQPSLAQLDRLLEACGKDLRLVVVQRHADLDALFTSLARAPLSARLRDEQLTCLSRPFFVAALAALPGRVHLAGPWAAQLAGLPVEPAPARLLVEDADPVLDGLTKAMWIRGRLVLDGQVTGIGPHPKAFRSAAVTVWDVVDVGRLSVQLVPDGAEWPPSVVVDVDGQALPVTPPDQLDPDRDGVQPEVLRRWRAWRRTAELPVVPWYRPPTHQLGDR